MPKLYLGFDAGTQSVKVSVYDENLNNLTSQSLPTILRYPNPGWVEMDLDEFLDITIRCIKRCTEDIKALGYDPKDIRAVMGDGIICGIAGVNEEGDAITPYVNYLDTRTEEDVRYINSLDLDIWNKETGNPQASTMFPAMFARWFLKTAPSSSSRALSSCTTRRISSRISRGLRARTRLLTGAPCPAGVWATTS